MNAGVAVKVDTEADRDDWTKLLEAFGIQTVYELPGLGVPLGDSILVENASQISNFQAAPLVAVQPIDADFVQGKTSLSAFEHPDGAIYIFGGTMTRLTRGDIRGANLHDIIYITAGDLYPAQAGAIVLWDRYMKAVS